MKIFKLILSLTAITSCCFLYSCDPFDKCGGDYEFRNYNNFGFNILNKKTKHNVLLIGETPYNYDTVKVYNEDWSVAYPGPVPFDGLVSLRFIDEQKDKDVVDQLISRRFYMYFNYQDIDTIDIGFETKYNKCHDQVMKYFKVAYNDSVYFDGPAPGDQTPGAYFLKEY